MKKPMRKVKKFDAGGYTGDDPIVKYRMGQISEDEANIALGRPGMVKGSLSQEEEKSPVRSMAKPAAPATPAEVKTEVKTTSEDIFDETGAKSKFKRNQETGDLYTLEDTPKPAKPVAKKASSSSSTSNASPAAAPAAKPAAKAEAKVEPKAEAKDDKPVAKKLTDEEKFDAEVKRLRLENVNKPYPKKKSFFEDLKDKFGGKRVSGATPSSDKDFAAQAIKRGGVIKKMASGGKVKSASARADGCAIRGKTRA